MSYNPPNPNGQATKDNSAPVVIASDQDALPISGSIAVSSSSLPTGAATGTKQDTGNASLSSIDGKITAVNTGAVTVASSALPTGAATSANQTNGTQQTKLTDGTTVPNMVANDTGYNGQVINNGTKTISFTTSAAGAQTLLANTNIQGYSSVTLQLTSIGTGLAFTIPFAASSGGTYQTTSTWMRTDQVTNSMVAPQVVVNVHQISRVVNNYLQISISALTSGTVTGTLTLSTLPLIPQTMGVSAALGSIAILADATSSTNSNSIGQAFNGATADRMRNNVTAALIAAGATTTQTVTLTTYNARALSLIFNISAYTSGTINIAVNGLSSSSYAYPLISSITGLTATGVNAYHVGVGLTAAVGQYANIPLPRTVQVVISGTFVATYGVDYVLGL